MSRFHKISRQLAPALTLAVGLVTAAAVGTFSGFSLAPRLLEAQPVNGRILVATRTLTNAQIKALPTTPIQILAAPGAGFRTRVIAASVRIDNSAGVYTNVDTSYAAIALEYTDLTGPWAAVGPVNDDTLGVPLATLTDFLNNSHEMVVDLIDYMMAVSDGSDGDTGWVVPGQFMSNWGDVQNKTLMLTIDNNGTGNLTGGNAANDMTVVVYYAIEAM